MKWPFQLPQDTLLDQVLVVKDETSSDLDNLNQLQHAYWSESQSAEHQFGS